MDPEYNYYVICSYCNFRQFIDDLYELICKKCFKPLEKLNIQKERKTNVSVVYCHSCGYKHVRQYNVTYSNNCFHCGGKIRDYDGSSIKAKEKIIQ